MGGKIGGALRRSGVAVLVTVLLPTGLAAQAVGGGVSVWVPWDMFEGQTGSISFETSLETALGLGDYFSIPVGFAYNQVYGASVVGTVAADDDPFRTSGPWFYADSLLPYIVAKAHLPIGPVYFDLFGGGAGNVNASLRPLHDRIARDLRDAGTFGSTDGRVAVTDLTVDSGFGLGWIAGTAAGVTFDDVSISLSATYRHIRHDLTLSGRYFRDDGTGGEFDSSDEDFAIEDLAIIMQGISFGIGGSIEL